MIAHLGLDTTSSERAVLNPKGFRPGRSRLRTVRCEPKKIRAVRSNPFWRGPGRDSGGLCMGLLWDSCGFPVGFLSDSRGIPIRLPWDSSRILAGLLLKLLCDSSRAPIGLTP